MRSSSDWVRGPSGRWAREPVQQTRGLNRNFNHTLKPVFKGAATTVIARAGDGPLHHHYEHLLEGGTKPESGEADDRASARLDRVSDVAHGRSVRPQETGSTGSDEVSEAGIGERGVEGGHDMGSDEPEADRLQGDSIQKHTQPRTF